ncbi:GntR family transcriptional regulator [Alteromonadaceae bacterium BrNp21-10]|nr:GntR family transcriptional regulator [Alteromonadaceae bacterium BrNp21-10]
MQNRSPIKSLKIDYDRSTPQQVFDFLREQVVAMEILPGQKIPENQLAEQFGVSRTPIREAIAKLVNLGFIEVRPQRGTFVSKLSITKILEARFIREALEVAIICQVTEHHTQELVDQCEAIITLQEQAAGKHDALQFQNLDDLFHQKLADFTHFDRAASLIQSEKAHMDRVRNLSLQELGGQYDRVLSQHRNILDAIKSGDVNKARTATCTHMREVLNILGTVEEMHPDYFEEHIADWQVKPQLPAQ